MEDSELFLICFFGVVIVIILIAIIKTCQDIKKNNKTNQYTYGFYSNSMLGGSYKV